MSEAKRLLLLLGLLASIVFSCIMPMAQGQTLSGRLVITTDRELYGLGSLDGGGHVTWSFTDEQAAHLRAKIAGLFSGYPQMPPGYVCEGVPTQSNDDTVIDSPEALTYTERLENLMEGSCSDYAGTKDRYLTITKTDIAEKQMPVDRSTENLVGSVAASTSRLSIRFIFNAGTNYESIRFNLGGASMADAPHKVFEFDQTSFFLGNAMPPLQAFEGWHNVSIGSESAFTPSYTWNSALPATNQGHWGYTNSSWNSSLVQPTYTSPNLRGTIFSRNWTDLRFVDTAFVAVNYTGFRADAGDSLRLQVSSNAPIFNTWTDVVENGGGTMFQNTPWLEWRTARFSLDPYLGQIVRLRLNFSSDANAMPAPGFFVKGFEIKGESNYHGFVQHDSTDYIVSTTSFSDFAMSKGSANMIRTPAGDILFYSITYNTEDGTPPDSVQYRSFDFLENPQITFGLTVASAYLIAYYQGRYFNQFKVAHPMRYRPAAGKIKWLHWLGRILIILLIVFYFFPGLLAFAAAGFLIGGPAMWFLGVFFTIGVALLSKFMYMRQTKFIPPDTFEEGAGGIVEAVPPPPGEEPARQFCADCLNIIESPANAYKCGCGKAYHRLCASQLKECPECHRKIVIQLPKEKMLTVQCPTCREIQHVKEGADLSRTRCAKCDTVLRALDEGLNYLVIDKDPATSYSWFLGIVRRERPALCMTTSFPEKVVKEYGLEGVDLYWLSDTNPGPKTLDPKRLDFEVIRAISNFAKDRKGGVILLDGLEYLVVENGFDKTFKFIKRINDLCSVHGATFMVPITPGALGQDELTVLKKEFDRVEELAAPPPPPKKRQRAPG